MRPNHPAFLDVIVGRATRTGSDTALSYRGLRGLEFWDAFGGLDAPETIPLGGMVSARGKRRQFGFQMTDWRPGVERPEEGA